jgi:hypothetical protein
MSQSDGRWTPTGRVPRTNPGQVSCAGAPESSPARMARPVGPTRGSVPERTQAVSPGATLGKWRIEANGAPGRRDGGIARWGAFPERTQYQFRQDVFANRRRPAPGASREGAGVGPPERTQDGFCEPMFNNRCLRDRGSGLGPGVRFPERTQPPPTGVPGRRVAKPAKGQSGGSGIGRRAAACDRVISPNEPGRDGGRQRRSGRGPASRRLQGRRAIGPGAIRRGFRGMG